jgi:hypothetical protein
MQANLNFHVNKKTYIYKSKFIIKLEYKEILCLFRIVVMMTVQNTFHLEIHQNKIFLFFKNHF